MIHLAKAQCQSSEKVIFKTMYLERILLEKIFFKICNHTTTMTTTTTKYKKGKKKESKQEKKN